MKKVFYLLVLCLFFSCSNSKENNHTLTGLFADRHHAISDEMPLDFDSIRNPYMILCINQCIVFADIFQPDFMTVFNEKSGKYIGNFLAKGNGPNEFVHLSSMQRVGEKLFLWDSGKSNMAFIEMNKDSLENYKCRFIPIHQDSIFISAFQVFALDEDYFVSSGVIKGHRFAILDKKGEPIAYFGEYPESDSEKEKSDVELALSNQCSYAYQPEKQILVVGNGMGENIQFYDLANKYSPRLIKEYNFSSPQYKMDGEGSVIYQKENIIGFTDLLPHSDYCIGFFSGETLKDPGKYGSNKLLFFDWEGNPVKMINLEDTYSNITINEEGNRVYLLGKDPQTGDFKIYTITVV